MIVNTHQEAQGEVSNPDDPGQDGVIGDNDFLERTALRRSDRLPTCVRLLSNWQNQYFLNPFIYFTPNGAYGTEPAFPFIQLYVIKYYSTVLFKCCMV